MRYRPLYNKILVRPIPEGEFRTESGIIITETVSPVTRTEWGEVVAVGDGMINPDGSMKELIVKVGDKVLYRRGSGIEIQPTLTSEKLIMFVETDLYCIEIPTPKEELTKVMAIE
jgi:chaperonin GroES